MVIGQRERENKQALLFNSRIALLLSKIAKEEKNQGEKSCKCRADRNRGGCPSMVASHAYRFLNWCGRGKQINKLTKSWEENGAKHEE